MQVFTNAPRCIRMIFLFTLTVFYSQSKAQVSADTVDQNFVLDEVILSADKSSSQFAKISQHVQTIPQRQINLLQSQNLADLLMNSGQVFVQKSQQGGGSPILRGFEANKVLLVVDGVRMNNAIYRGGHLQNAITLDNYSLQKVEVLNGPASNIYGSDALGGVIHVYTKAPVFAEPDQKNVFFGNAFVRVGSANNEKSGHLDFFTGNKKLASFTSITASSFGDLIMGKRINPAYGKEFGLRPFYVENINGKDSLITNSNPYKQVFTGYKQIDIVQKFSHKVNEHLSQGLNIQYSNSTDVPRYDRLTDPSPTTILNQAEWYYGPQQRLLIAYDINGTKAQNGSWHLGINYQKIQESRHNRRFGSSSLNSRIEDLNILGFSADRKWNSAKHRINYGLDGQFNDLVSTAFRTNIKNKEKSPLDTRYPDGTNTMYNIGAYGTHQWTISDRFTLNDGLRIGYSNLASTFVDKSFFAFPFNSIKQSSPTYSGSIGLVMNTTQKSKLGFVVSSGFRVPNIDDIGKIFESTATTVIVPNPELRPEQTVSMEINGAWRLFDDHIEIQGAIFNTELYNAIAVDKFTYDGKDSIVYNGVKAVVMASQNKNRARVQGIQTQVSYTFLTHFRVDGSMHITSGSVINGEKKSPLDHIPPMMTRLSISYNAPKFSASIYELSNGWKRLEKYSTSGEDNLPYATELGMPRWFTLNLKASYKLGSYIEILGGIENILDLQYRTFASGMNSSGRNFSLTAKVKF